MKVTRRQALAGVGAAGIASLAGCLGGSGPYEATVAEVAPSTVEATDYERVRSGTVDVTYTASVLGVLDRQVETKNSLVEYARVVDVPFLGSYEAAIFVVFATPEVEILGGANNPLADMTNRELAETVMSYYDRFTVRNLSEESIRRDVPMLDTTTRIVRYRGEAELEGQGDSIDIYLHVGDPVHHGSDFVVPAAGHPRDLDENSAIDTLVRGIEHDAGD